MNPGELLTRWSAVLALSLYVLSLALRTTANGSRPRLVRARAAWTAGCFFFLVHVASAFQFYHHWSHAAAYAATAQRTRELAGFEWGGGLYANYAFTLLWLTDASFWWRGLDHYEARPRPVEWAVQCFLGFMALNGTVVFGTWAVRWFGLGACLLLAAMWGFRVCRSRPGSPL